MGEARRLARVVPAAAAGMRLDRWLGTLAVFVSRSHAKQMIDAGRVRLDGARCKASYALRGGERLTVEVPPPVATAVGPEPLPLVVLYEDADVLAIDKPPGMVVHPAPGARRGTVVNALLHRLGPLAGVGDPERPGIVHRLDRDTSGVLLIARTAAALAALGQQFRDRQVTKHYLAVVHGRVAAATGTIDRAIGRHPRERKRMSVHSPRGRSAVTRYEMLERFPAATLLRLVPETGRTHQLRVHLAAIGHPIVGDKLYGRPRHAVPASLSEFPRQALHAAEIHFRHPATGASVVVCAPLPDDLAGLCAALRQAAATAGKSSRSG